ncbi:unnamed protein product [Brassicogethes aeneus]|uniref:Phosphatidylinositol-specific phospholipase C X domain-containing protein n=1 Tax=Brassicogethes aeneus TaxID=1431903 RepID=A0A9P0BLM5_BRAAE|nr:unnamed protein product [Brassicogethes aeneus]
MSTTESKQKNASEIDLENWMFKLSDTLKIVPIIYLAIPGSHDSFTANISSKSKISPDAEPFIRNLSVLGPVVKYFIANWSRTQDFIAQEQLKNGIRYFDLRISTKVDDEDFYFVHGLYSDKVYSVFEEIKEFLKDHPGEVIILDCQHFYAFMQEDHNKLMALITKTFGTKLLPYTQHMEAITLKYMVANNYQIITIYRSEALRFGQPFLWPSSSFPTPWPNTVSKENLFQYLDNGLAHRDNNIGYISQCILTPSNRFIFFNILSTLRQKGGIELEEDRNNWILKHKPGGNGLNIVISDFMDLTNNSFSKSIISLNSDDLYYSYTKSKNHTVVSIPKALNKF